MSVGGTHSVRPRARVPFMTNGGRDERCEAGEVEDEFVLFKIKVPISISH